MFTIRIRLIFALNCISKLLLLLCLVFRMIRNCLPCRRRGEPPPGSDPDSDPDPVEQQQQQQQQQQQRNNDPLSLFPSSPSTSTTDYQLYESMLPSQDLSSRVLCEGTLRDFPPQRVEFDSLVAKVRDIAHM